MNQSRSANDLSISRVSFAVYGEPDDDGFIEEIPGYEGLGEITVLVPREVIGRIGTKHRIDLTIHEPKGEA